MTEWSPEVQGAVSKLQSENQVSCDLAKSEQKEGGAANRWTQVAHCTPSGTLTVTYDIVAGAREEDLETTTLVSSQFQK